MRLDRLERWFQREVAGPRRGGAERHVLPSRTLPPDRRVGIYADMYEARLRDCLAEDFKAVRHLVGQQGFDRLARAYVARHPSRHPSLNVLGRHLPRFLERPLLVDVARLEQAMTEVFDAPECTPLSPAALAAVPAERLVASRLVPIPALRLLELHHDADGIVTAVRQGKPLPSLRRKASTVLVWRKDDVVWRATLDPVRAALLRALLSGRSVGAALRAAPRDARLAEKVERAFRDWTADGVFAAVEPAQARKSRR